MRLGRGSPNTINDHLDSWWARLGSRLRDLPDRQFPQLPERIGSALQSLWNEALDAAHEALGASAELREARWREQDALLTARVTELDERERSVQVRSAALEESLTLARTQLTESNQRAASLESALRERDNALAKVNGRLDKLEAEHTALTQKAEAERARYQGERNQLEKRHEAAESRWLTELDRARQSLKLASRHTRALQTQLTSATKERDSIQLEVAELRAELRAATALQAQLTKRLRATPNTPPRTVPAKRNSRGRKTRQ